MKDLTFWAIAFTFLLTSCGNGKSFTVKGKLADKSADGTLLLLQQVNFETGETKILDSAQVKGDEFEFKGEATGEIEFNIISPKKPDGKFATLTFVRELGDIEINVKDHGSYVLSGTKTNEQFEKMQSSVFALQQKASKITTQQQQEALIKEIIGVVYAYVKENMQNRTGEQLFSSIAYQLDATQLKELLKNARPSFTQKEQVKMMQKAIEAKSKMESSKQYQDVPLTDTKDQKVSLSSYMGKANYVLVDFWASWCGPCMEEMPNVAAAYAKFKSKGFEVIGISVDKDNESWLKAINEKKLVWTQLHDAAGNAAQVYGVSSIPYSLLIDKSGKIIAENLRGNELEKKLNELLH